MKKKQDPWNRVLLEKLIVIQVANNFRAIYGRVIAVSTGSYIEQQTNKTNSL
jgi:hypothetical protein